MKIKSICCIGAGYVGGVIVDLLIKKKYDVTVFDNLLYEESLTKGLIFMKKVLIYANQNSRS